MPTSIEIKKIGFLNLQKSQKITLRRLLEFWRIVEVQGR
jgi:hypothetical protein